MAYTNKQKGKSPRAGTRLRDPLVCTLRSPMKTLNCSVFYKILGARGPSTLLLLFWELHSKKKNAILSFVTGLNLVTALVIVWIR